MKLSTRLLGTSYHFRSVKELLARANEARSGDELAGIAARSEQERIAAKTVLANLTLNDLRENPVVAYDRDEVTRVIDDALDRDAFAAVRNKTVGAVSYTHLRAHETRHDLVCRLLLEKKKK